MTDSTQLVPIPVPTTDRPLMALAEGDTQWVAIRPICDHLGIDPDTQRRKLDQAEWACTVLKTVQLPGDTQRREVVMLDADHLPMWLATIKPSRVNESARPILIAFQREATKALRDYFYRGVAVAPSNRPTTIDGIRAMLDQIEAAQQEADRANARLDAIEGLHDWMSALGYAKLHQFADTSAAAMRKLGNVAGAHGRSLGLTPNKAQHQLFGEVNLWPVHVWEAAATELGWLA